MPLEPLSVANPALSLEDAMAHAQIKSPGLNERIEVMDWEALGAKLAAIHEGSTQRGHLARLALDQIRQGVNELAALGHHFTLSDADAPKGQDYPKMLYHPTLGEQVVNSKSEQDLMSKDGWDEHPSLRSQPSAKAPVRSSSDD